MKIALLFGLAFVLSACVVKERYPPYVSRYDQRDVVIYDSPRYVPHPDTIVGNINPITIITTLTASSFGINPSKNL